MKKQIRIAIVCVLGILAMGASNARAANDDGLADMATESAMMKKAIDGKIQALLDAPSGVFDIEYDACCGIIRLKIKGEAEVSTALSGARADRQAREKAGRDARAAFTKFLNEDITIVETEAEGFMISEKDGTESAEFQNVSAKLIAIHSTALLRGLIPLMDQVEGEGANRKAVVVLGWSRKLSNAALGAKETMARTGTDSAVGTVIRAEPVSPSGNTNTVTRVGELDNF